MSLLAPCRENERKCVLVGEGFEVYGVIRFQLKTKGTERPFFGGSDSPGGTLHAELLQKAKETQVPVGSPERRASRSGAALSGPGLGMETRQMCAWGLPGVSEEWMK